MRIQLKDMTPQLHVQICGLEPWLGPLYSGFPQQLEDHQGSASARPLLKADFDLMLEEAGSVQVTGEVRYSPIVNCSRCDRLIPWPLHIPLNVRFLPAAYNSVAKETNLSLADLDAYFLDGDELDLECLINDAVQTALPSRMVPEAIGDNACSACLEPTADGQVYGEDNSEASPFAALKGLKLPN